MAKQQRPPEKHFRAVWYISMAQVAIVSLPLEYLGIGWWPAFTRDLGIWAFAWFLSSEWSAGGVRGGFVGTKTGFLYWTVTDRWPRVLLGLWMGLVIIWRFPTELYLNWILGVPMTLWLPPHYWRSGMKGPIDHAAIWFAERVGLDKLIKRVRG